MNARDEEPTFAAPAAEVSALRFDGFELRPVERLLLRYGAPVKLGGRALDILILLLERPGDVFSRNEIQERVWAGVNVGDGSLRFHVAELRKALDDGSEGRRFVANVPGRGYSFVARLDDQDLPAKASERPVYGRSAAISELELSLSRSRLVSLIAPGGMGKTTVARELTTASGSRWKDRSIWVDLSSATDQAAIAAQIAAALSISTASDDPVSEIASWLRERELLLVLDCCDLAAPLVGAIAERVLHGTEGTLILATSRERLTAPSELVVELPPLALPGESKALRRLEALSYSAVELFAERAALASGFEMTDDTASSAARICASLDGIPLAIEIAAAHLTTFGLNDLESAIKARLHLGEGGRKAAEPRHRTLSTTLAWSYELLSEIEQQMIARLSVFEGGVSLEAVRGVAPAGAVRDADVLVLLEDLANKSLIRRERIDERSGFRLLDTTRAFASDRLEEQGDRRVLRIRHAAFMLQCARSSRIEGEDPAAVVWFGPHCPNLANLRAALQWAFSDDGDRETAIALAGAATPLFMQLSLLAESERWAEMALRAIGEAPGAHKSDRVRLLAFRGAAMLGSQGPVDISLQAMEQALEAAEAQDEPAFSRLALSALFWLYVYRGEPIRAIAAAELLVTSAIDPADRSGDLIAENCIASASTLLGDQAKSLDLLEAIARRQPLVDTGRFMRIGSDPGIFSKVFKVKTLWLLGRFEAAGTLYDACLPALRIPEHGLYHCYGLNEVMIPMLCSQERWEEARATALELIDASANQGMAIRRSSASSAAMAIEILAGEGDVTEFGHSLAILRHARFLSFMPWLEWVLAIGFWKRGDADRALATLDEAIAASRQSRSEWWLPELLRLKGEILGSLRGGMETAQSALVEAFDLGRRQSSHLLALRAASSLFALAAPAERAAFAPRLRDALGALDQTVSLPDTKRALALLMER